MHPKSELGNTLGRMVFSLAAFIPPWKFQVQKLTLNQDARQIIIMEVIKTRAHLHRSPDQPFSYTTIMHESLRDKTHRRHTTRTHVHARTHYLLFSNLSKHYLVYLYYYSCSANRHCVSFFCLMIPSVFYYLHRPTVVVWCLWCIRSTHSINNSQHFLAFAQHKQL